MRVTLSMTFFDKNGKTMIVIVFIKNQSGEENILLQRLQCHNLNKTIAFLTRRLLSRDVCCLWFHNANDNVKS